MGIFAANLKLTLESMLVASCTTLKSFIISVFNVDKEVIDRATYNYPTVLPLSSLVAQF